MFRRLTGSSSATSSSSPVDRGAPIRAAGYRSRHRSDRARGGPRGGRAGRAVRRPARTRRRQQQELQEAKTAAQDDLIALSNRLTGIRTDVSVQANPDAAAEQAAA